MTRIRKSNASDGQRLVTIWRASVDATHDFLTPEDRQSIDTEVQSFLPMAEVWLAVDDHDQGIGFMGLADGRIESLFIHADHRGRGVGRALVDLAQSTSAVLTVEANEQSPQAVGFYQHLGFVIVGRSEDDEAGRPYPLLFLERRQAPDAACDPGRTGQGVRAAP